MTIIIVIAILIMINYYNYNSYCIIIIIVIVQLHGSISFLCTQRVAVMLWPLLRLAYWCSWPRLWGDSCDQQLLLKTRETFRVHYYDCNR